MPRRLRPATADGLRVATARILGAAGCLLLLLIGTNLILLAAVAFGLLAGVTGTCKIATDPDRAHLSLGAAIVATTVLLPALSSSVPLAVVDLVAVGCFVGAWHTVDRLRTERRRAWGVRQKDILARQQELATRKHALANRPRHHPDDVPARSRGPE